MDGPTSEREWRLQWMRSDPERTRVLTQYFLDMSLWMAEHEDHFFCTLCNEDLGNDMPSGTPCPCWRSFCDECREERGGETCVCGERYGDL